MKRAPAYKLLTDRLVVRCYEPRDAHDVHEVVTRNKAHLVPFMGWALREPTSFEERVDLLRSFRGRFDLGDDYYYGIFLRDGSFVGGTGLHPRVGPNGIEIGYWIDERHEGKGFVTEVAAALAKHALTDLALGRVEIHCDPENGPSNRIAEKLGFTREGLLRKRHQYAPDRPMLDLVFWTLFREDMGRAARVNWARYQAYDAIDRPIT
ncbi:MAG: GNAT family N-acetyltransferase [Deltaproteobacteria bacterium]|jgi:RimJ/RimL family protein N-acetyltransferase